MKAHALLTFLLIASVSVLVSCGAKKELNRDQEIIVQAYRLIDADRTDEAMQLMEEAVRKEPDNYEFRSVLASAYAHKGNFRVQRFISIINKSRAFSDVTKKLKQAMAENERNKSTNQINTFVLNVAHLMTLNANFFQMYIEIPLLSPKDIVYIKQAIYTLDEFEDKIKPEDALFRAILRILLFKHVLSENLLGEFTPPAKKSVDTCKLDFVRVNDHVIELSKTLIATLRDLSISHPKKELKYAELSGEIAEIASSVSLAITGISVLDEVSEMFLKDLALQHQLGKLIRCN